MYIERRRKKLYAIHDIPRDLRETLGAPGKPKARFVQSLDTEDSMIAKRRAVPLEARWRLQIEQARRGSVDPIERQGRFWRLELKAANDHERPLLEEALKAELDGMVDAAASRAGVDNHEDEYHDLPEQETAARIFAIATGTLVRLDEHLDEFIATLQGQPKSIDQKRSSIKLFVTKFTYLSDVTRKGAQGWINSLAKDGRAVATIRRQLSELRSYWAYLVSIEAVPEDSAPFDRLTVPRPPKNGQDTRKPFSPTQVVGLLNRAIADGDEALADLIRLGMWTGARLESLCILRTTEVDGEAFEVLDDKSSAGKRVVPIHSKLKATMKRLVDGSTDGYIMSGLTLNKYGDRSAAIGKRFGRMKRAMGYGKDHVFHSIRKTVATILDNAGVPENVAADIVGHEKPTMTYGLYSGGSSLEVKRTAIEKLSYSGIT